MKPEKMQKYYAELNKEVKKGYYRFVSCVVKYEGEILIVSPTEWFYRVLWYDLTAGRDGVITYQYKERALSHALYLGISISPELLEELRESVWHRGKSE